MGVLAGSRSALYARASAKRTAARRWPPDHATLFTCNQQRHVRTRRDRRQAWARVCINTTRRLLCLHPYLLPSASISQGGVVPHIDPAVRIPDTPIVPSTYDACTAPAQQNPKGQEGRVAGSLDFILSGTMMYYLCTISRLIISHMYHYHCRGHRLRHDAMICICQLPSTPTTALQTYKWRRRSDSLIARWTRMLDSFDKEAIVVQN